MKKILSLAASIIIVFNLFGCSSETTETKGKVKVQKEYKVDEASFAKHMKAKMEMIAYKQKWVPRLKDITVKGGKEVVVTAKTDLKSDEKKIIEELSNELVIILNDQTQPKEFKAHKVSVVDENGNTLSDAEPITKPE